MKFRIYLVLILILAGKSLFAQTDFYHTDTIREIKLYFYETDWDHVLDSLYVDGLKERTLCSLLIDGVFYDNVGVRYKGYSSVSVNRTKNPFNIKLDYMINGQNHQGIDKLKLGNVIQDPSFVREVLTYEIARKYMPASQANYANVYINDTLWGLYTSIEAVNKDFVSKHFDSRNNAFFKCSPENLDLYGENANLGNSPGTDTSDYYSLYDMESDFGWTQLYNLIDTLNDHPEDIQHILNVDRTLWMHALNYTFVNFDSYVGYAQNYYIYQDDNRRFNPILWDMNMSFGSFRLADASEFYYDGFTIQEAFTLDPLTHYNSFSVYERPLLRNLFENDRFRRMYIAHIRTIVEENISNQEYENRAIVFRNIIDSSVQNDTNKFYSYQMYLDNLDMTVSDLIDYPGITELMSNREQYLLSYPGFQGSPDIDSIQHFPEQVLLYDDIYITAQVQNASSVYLAYRFSTNGVFQEVEMFDNGLLNDGASGDGTFGGMISVSGNTIQYYIYAENDSAGRFSPERAAYEFYTIQSQIQPGELVINELEANNTMIQDQNGEYEDWIELYNPSLSDMSTSGLFLSDNSSIPTKWPLPDVIIPPDSYLVIWADEDSQQNGYHANFRLSSLGEELILAYGDSTIIDSVSFGVQAADSSYGRSPNGIGGFTELSPTIGSNNDYAGIDEKYVENQFSCFPNPFGSRIVIEHQLKKNSTLELSDINGRLLMRESISKNENSIVLNTSTLAKGVYFIKLYNTDYIESIKIIKTQ